VLLGAPGVASAQTADPVAVVTAFGEALNAGDGATALGLFADDAVVRTPGGGVYTGKQQIGAYAQALIAQHYHAEVDRRDVQVAGERVISRGKVWLDEWRQLGIAPLESIAEAVVRDGKIVSLMGSFTPESAAKLQAAMAAAQRPPVQAPRALPRTGEAGTLAGAVATVGALVLLAGFAVRRWPGRGR
jgi:LPXTG-motif cell wall-anchored protein